jgi:hypothetical protein
MGGPSKSEVGQQQQQSEVERYRKYQRDYQRSYYSRLSPEARAAREQKHRQWLLNNPERLALYKERHKEQRRTWRRANPDRAIAKNRRYSMKRYGITVEQYDHMLASQGGVCALCGCPPHKKRLSVDHDHNTGAIRGLLCVLCNSTIGRIESMISRNVGRNMSLNDITVYLGRST